MLMLNTIAKEQPFTLQADEYMLFKLDFQPPVTSVDESYYWRSMNSKYLLEVGLAVATGVVNSMTLVLVPPAWKVQRPSIKDLCEVEDSGKRGLPVFRLDPWNEKISQKVTGADPALRTHVEHLSFKLLAPDGLAILFDNFEPSSMVINKELRFLFNAANEWCGLIANK